MVGLEYISWKQRKAQIGIEFFLILGFSLSIVGMLIVNSEHQIAENDKLNAAILSLSALNGVSNAINTVFLQGNGSSLRTQVFIPDDTRCFVLNATTKTLMCDIGDASNRVVHGMQLYSVPSNISDWCYYGTGWVDVKVNSNQSFINMYCSPMQ